MKRASEERGGALALLAPPPAPPRIERARGRTERASPPGPPGSGGAGKGGHGGGDGRSGGDPPSPDGPRAEAKAFAFGLFLLAICILFLTFLIAWALLRSGPNWPREGAHPPVAGLLASSLLLLASEIALARTEQAKEGARSWLLRAAALGLAFLLAQAWLWREQLVGGLHASSNAYGAIFYSLTGLHALHVLGGVAYMLLLFVRSRAAPRALAGGLRLCRVYWRTMAGIWLVLLGVLLFGG